MTSELFTLRGLLGATTPADRVLCVALVAGALALPVLARPGDGGPARAVVTAGREEVAVIPLDRDGVTTVRGRIGDVTLAVESGAIRVADAGCPQRVCVASGAKRRAGELIACVPNGVLVRIEGGRPADDAPDAVTR